MTTERLLHSSRHTERGAIGGRIQEYRGWIAIIDNSSHIEGEGERERAIGGRIQE